MPHACKLSWIQHPAAFCVEKVLDVSQNKLDAVSAEHLKGIGGRRSNGLGLDLSVNTWNQLCHGLIRFRHPQDDSKRKMHVQKSNQETNGFRDP